MKPDIVLVVGAPRSGTSMVAQVVNRLGWHVGASVPPPIPPTWRSDFEDFDFSMRLARGERPSAPEIGRYLFSRLDLAVALGFPGGRFMLKSPLLALVWPQLTSELKRLSFTWRTISVWRQFSEREESRLAGPPGLAVEVCQEVVRAMECWVVPDLEIAYRKATEDPVVAVRALASVLSVDDDAAVAEAAKLILPARKELHHAAVRQTQPHGRSPNPA